VLGQHTLQPGERTELKAVFDTKNAPGPFEKITTIQTDAPGQEQIELVMAGMVKEAPGPKIAVLPRRTDLGAVKPGEAKQVKITVTNPGELPLTITAVKVRPGGAIAVAAGALPAQIAAGQKAELMLIISIGRPGTFTERISLQSNAKNAPKSGFVLMVSGRAE